ncbi:MAG TPA: hypothetical protein P5044_05900 [bacterium]|nr:hypothetical protein [bacterium]
MTREELIKKTNAFMKKLPSDKLSEVYDFVEYLFSKNENRIIAEGLKKLSSGSEALYFLNDKEEDIYTVCDVKEEYK